MQRTVNPSITHLESTKIPLSLKWTYSLFMLVLVPFYWHTYGPTNFLYFCDVALFMTLLALWLESPLLASAATVGILIPQALWMIDFLGGAVGFHITGMTAYMFDPGIRLFARGLSFFHFWLPILLLWMVMRLGYDRRALWVWTGLAFVLLLICYFWMPAPPAPVGNPNLPVNINYVYGFNDSAPQTWMDPNLYFSSLLLALPLLIYAPTHLLLSQLFSHPNQV